MLVRALPADRIMEEEPALLQLSRENMPHLPVEALDVLIIDRVGKDISGTIIDPNIVGRMKIRGELEPELPDVKAIVATDITPASHGNVVGIGFADVITRRALEKIDFDATYENTVTSSFLERGKLPVTAPDDRTAYLWARRSCGKSVWSAPWVLRIQDTLHLSEAYASASVIDELRDSSDIRIVGDYTPMFDGNGNLVPF
jgi:hypothetical protein